jgi:hypothetical protein
MVRTLNKSQARAIAYDHSSGSTPALHAFASWGERNEGLVLEAIEALGACIARDDQFASEDAANVLALLRFLGYGCVCGDCRSHGCDPSCPECGDS